MKLFLTALLILCGVNDHFGQECAPTESKKAKKYFDDASTNSKYDLRQRIDVFRRSLEEDPNCVECLFGKARAEYALASEGNTSYDRAYRNFTEVVATCPSFHADAFYYAGIIAYGNQDYENAEKYFEGFLAFDTAVGKTSRDHAKKESDIAQVLPEVRFYNDFYSNPIDYNPRRLANINTSSGEYLPMLSPDNELIFFTRKSKEKAMGDLYAKEIERFMMATQVEGLAEYEGAEALAPPFNVGDNYGGVSLSLDNKEMFITVCKPMGSGGYKNCDIYVSEYEQVVSESGQVSYRWGGLESLGDAVNTPSGWEAQPTLSADGNTLYFATIRENTTPDKDGNPTIDIYYTNRNEDGTWTQAKSIGNKINTSGNDKSPFLHADSRTMYFASNGHLGAGGYDIFYSKEDESGWSKPKNIGYPVNSPQDEHGLVVSTDGKIALFSSSNVASAQGLDIFAFDVPKEARPEKVLILKGDVKNDDGDLLTDAKIEIKYAKSKEVKEVEVDAIDGSYAAIISLRKEEDVVVSVKSESEDLAFNTRVFTMADTANTVRDLELKVEKLESGKTYRMNDIRFATGSSQIDEASKSVLAEFADYLNENETYDVEIFGHTDDIGEATANLALSTDRAFEVFGYLQELRVDPSRMKFKGFGETKPLVPNQSAENRAINRRTEFKIIKR